jgi:hypothetical protein
MITRNTEMTASYIRLCVFDFRLVAPDQASRIIMCMLCLVLPCYFLIGFFIQSISQRSCPPHFNVIMLLAIVYGRGIIFILCLLFRMHMHAFIQYGPNLLPLYQQPEPAQAEQ